MCYIEHSQKISVQKILAAALSITYTPERIRFGPSSGGAYSYGGINERGAYKVRQIFPWF